MDKKCKKIVLESYIDDRGALTAIEELRDVPFEIKRVFFIQTDNSDAVRGEHANLFNEVIICISGSCKIQSDIGSKKELFVLEQPMQALYIPKMLWKKIYDFSDNCVLAVLADEHYDSNKVIYDYNQYLELKSDRK